MARHISGATTVVAMALLCFLAGTARAAGNEEGPFSLTWRREAAFAFAGGALSVAGREAVEGMDVPSVASLDRDGVNPLDRFATHYYSKKISYWSDTTRDVTKGLFVLSLAPHVAGKGEGGWRALFTDVVMYIEATALATGLKETAKGLTARPRPFAYNDGLPVGSRQRDNSFMSFWSGHTTHTFMTAVFTGYVFQARHPGSRWVAPVRAGGLSLASATALMRVRSGNNFPTDILAAAAAGSFIGWLVPRLHRTGDAAVPVTVRPLGTSGIRLTFRM